MSYEDEETQEYPDNYEEPSPTPEDEAPDTQPAKRARKSPTKGAVPPPIMEAETPDTLHGTVAFTRSVNLGPSRENNAHYRLELQFAYQPSMSWSQIAALAGDAFFQVKGIIFQEAGLDFSVDDGGIVHEILHEATRPRPAKDYDDEQESAPRRRSRDDDEDRPKRRDEVSEARSRRSRDDDEDDRPRRRSSGLGLDDMERPEHIKPKTWRELLDNPDAWWDNRERKESGEYSAKASDFKHKDTNESVWLRPFRRS